MAKLEDAGKEPEGEGASQSTVSPVVAITRESAKAAALALVDREGADCLSMRRLGAELGVGPMVVHYHTGGKDGLLDSVVDAVLAEMALPPLVPGMSWLDRLRDYACAYRAALVHHPKALPIVASRPTRARSPRVMEALLAVLRRGGLGPRSAWNIATALTAYVLGYVLLEVGEAPVAAPGPSSGGEPAQAHAKDTQPPVEYPLVAAAVAEMVTQGIDRDQAFMAGLDAFLAGLAGEDGEPPR